MKSRHFHAAPAARLPALLGMAWCLLALTSCAYMPWHSKAPPRAQPVNELVEAASDGTVTNAFPQYWKRNTLVVDFSAASSAGGAVILKPRAGAKWPVRMAFRVMPGTIGLLEVQADQRLLMPVTREGSKPVDLELVPGVYTPTSAQISVRWEARSEPAS